MTGVIVQGREIALIWILSMLTPIYLIPIDNNIFVSVIAAVVVFIVDTAVDVIVTFFFFRKRFYQLKTFETLFK